MDMALSTAAILRSRHLNPPEQEAIRAWEDELRKAGKVAESQRAWGSRLILLCRDVFLSGYDDLVFLPELRLYLKDADQAARAIHQIANDLFEEMEGRQDHASRQSQRPPVDRDHSPDFRSVNWDGRSFEFTPAQAAVVEILWDAYERKLEGVGHAHLLDKSGSDGKRLVDVFKGNPAWGTMIGQVPNHRGLYRLQPLPPPTTP
jgi:hypothetical protein